MSSPSFAVGISAMFPTQPGAKWLIKKVSDLIFLIAALL
jgi:hypothetical protein